MRTNYHTHHGICGHAEGSAREYIEEAINKGVKVLGFSDHSPSTRTGDVGFRMTPDDLELYIKDIEEAKQLFADKIDVYTGLEIEYINNYSEVYQSWLNQVDYFILGVHFVPKDTTSDELFSTYDFSKPKDLDLYADTIERALEELPIAFIAHPDLYLINYQKWDQKAEEIAHRICRLAKQKGTILEFNANGLRREKILIDGEMVSPYPRKEFFEIVKSYNLPVVVSSDCHSPHQVYDEYMVNGYNLAMEWGLNIIDKLSLKKNDV